MSLTAQDHMNIAARARALEARTGTQVVAAVVGKSDSYPEAPWKAFALGTTFAALVCVLVQLAAHDWPADFPGAGPVLGGLVFGALLALLTVVHASFARLFVDRIRCDVEVMQYAQSLFFRRGLDRVRSRVGVLLLISLFERKVVILADAGFDARVQAHDWAALADRIAFLLRNRTPAIALQAGLEALEALMLERGYSESANASASADAPLFTTDEP